MKPPRQRRRDGKAPLEVIEEAVHLVRTAPAGVLAGYYAGTIPFVLAMLYFWADMSRSPFAGEHLAEAALVLTLLFVWMKFRQTMFARALRAQVAGTPPPPWTFRQYRRIVMTQAILQPTALFALPIALVFLVPLKPPFFTALVLVLLGPFGWLYAFYQNLTVLDDGESERNRKLFARAWQQACLWPRQNHFTLGALGAFGLYVFLNWTIVSASLPGLVKMLFGIESIFSQSPRSLLNTTFFAAMLGLTFLCVDPIVKAVYLLRCFYGESLRSGEDLKAEVKQFAPAAASVAIGLMMLLALTATPSRAAESTASGPGPAQEHGTSASPSDLDHAIDKTLHGRKYTWRMPRKDADEATKPEGAVTKFFRKIARMLRSWADWLVDWLKKLFPRRRTSSGGSGEGWVTSIYILLYAVLAAVVIALVILVIRLWRDRGKQSSVVATEAVQPVPDLMDENVGADQLPEDGWTRLARELLERGEFRLAMRAFYLASLAHLANRNLISLARFKSNRDYTLELHRRGHAFPDLLSVFGENISAFERIWYGVHEVNRELVDRFAANVERIKGVL